jgi:hypothetical protein
MMDTSDYWMIDSLVEKATINTRKMFKKESWIMKIEVIKPKFYLVYYNKMLSIIVMADDDFELKKGLESLFMLDHIAKHIIIVDL